MFSIRVEDSGESMRTEIGSLLFREQFYLTRKERRMLGLMVKRQRRRVQEPVAKGSY
jgi:hypothetical protein